MHLLVEPTTGKVPNIEANNGTNLLILGSDDYRDFRPSQLACYSFSILGIPEPMGCTFRSYEIKNTEVVNTKYVDKKSKTFSSGGYH